MSPTISCKRGTRKSVYVKTGETLRLCRGPDPLQRDDEILGKIDYKEHDVSSHIFYKLNDKLYNTIYCTI